MKNNKEKFLQLVSKDKTNIVKKNKRRIKYRFLSQIRQELLIWCFTLRSLFKDVITKW